MQWQDYQHPQERGPQQCKYHDSAKHNDSNINRKTESTLNNFISTITGLMVTLVGLYREHAHFHCCLDKLQKYRPSNINSIINSQKQHSRVDVASLVQLHVWRMIPRAADTNSSCVCNVWLGSFRAWWQ